jgi:hypothetical protein
MRKLTYGEALRALNSAAWDAVTASKGIVTEGNPDHQALRLLVRETDRLVDELPSDRSRYDFHGETPVFEPEVLGARL